MIVASIPYFSPSKNYATYEISHTTYDKIYTTYDKKLDNIYEFLTQHMYSYDVIDVY